MMDKYGKIDIQEMPLGIRFLRSKTEAFLLANGLRLEDVDVYLTVQDADGRILAGGGLSKDIIKCVAVSEEARSLGLAAPLISELISRGNRNGYESLKVFTKPSNQAIFESLGFRLLGSAPKAILMENGQKGLKEYLEGLRQRRLSVVAGNDDNVVDHAIVTPDQNGGLKSGVIVMNANPCTLGHKYLIQTASAKVDRLFIIVVKEDVSAFSYEDRLAMVKACCQDMDNVVVCEGSQYQISAATFPTYFLKELSDAADTQMLLDIDIFARHIAPALGVTVRFVGSEPEDALTARYNSLMKEVLPGCGIEVVEIPRLCQNGQTVSASRVRDDAALKMLPPTSLPYALAKMAEDALKQELDTPLKPGLVGPDGNGAHKDMDYTLMQRSIDALHPYFVRMASAVSVEELQNLGIQAEQAMLMATGGVNTHKGAIFALGLALYARGAKGADNQQVLQKHMGETAHVISANNLVYRELDATAKAGVPASTAKAGVPASTATAQTHGGQVSQKYGVNGALSMARDGYKELFSTWLPYLRKELASLSIHEPASVKASGQSLQSDSYRQTALQKLLLLIMSSLDDTCVIYRVGYERAQEVKREAAEILRLASLAQNDNQNGAQNDSPERFSEALKALCQKYAAEGISPGGAADMLALTLFVNRVIQGYPL